MTSEQIANEILRHRKGENTHHALHYAIGRVGVEVTTLAYKAFWLYNRELDNRLGNFDQQRYILDKKTEKGVAKNSRMGEFLIKRQSGNYIIDRREHTISIRNFSSYQPVNIPEIDAINGTIEITGKRKIQFNSLYDLLDFLEEIKQDPQPALDQLLKDQQEAIELGKKLSEAEQEQLKKLSALTHYIRANNEMRMQAILDPLQEEIKRSRIFDGLLVIDGGPGTGKTTTLIQRIKFLTDDTIVEYGEQYRSILPQLKTKKGWIFFTPSILLLGYLRNAMTSEGLSATDATSKVWADYLNNELLKNYGLSGPEKPFQLYRQPIAPLFSNEGAVLKTALETFEKYILLQSTERIKKLAETKLLFDEGKALGVQIQGNSAGITESKDLVRLIINADQLQNRFKSSFDDLTKNIRSSLQEQTDIVLVRLKKDTENYGKITRHLKELFDKRQPVIDEEDEEGQEAEQALANVFNEEIESRRAIREWLKKIALNKINSFEKISEKQKELIDIIQKYAHDSSLGDLGKKLHFINKIQPIIQGSETMVFSKIAKLYKRFRKTLPDILAGLNLPGSAERLKKVLESDTDRLHYDERNFLILFINNLIRQLQRITASVYTSGKHNYISTFKEQQRYVIGIDEASDFSLLELACMHSFSHPGYNCTTLSGDLMQRMTNTGLKDWETFTDFMNDGDIKGLSVSYRQSPGLLNLAKQFYENVTGRKANYTSYAAPSPFEPKPVVKKIINIEEKVKWIAAKIIAIFKAYDNKVPSIAIFVPNDETVSLVAKKLSTCDKLADNGIDVRGISKDGATIDNSKVNVYNIESIKGLEFEAVFFIDIDKIENADIELLQKYIYVGISRSAYYLFLTYQDQLPSELQILKDFEEE